MMPAVCLVNDRYIYSFGGVIVECYDTQGEEKSFSVIEYKVYSYTGTYFSQAIQINEREILVFGKYNGPKSSFIFDIEEKKFSNTKNEPIFSAGFYNCSNAIKDGEEVFAIDELKNIHIYSIEKKIWY